MSDTEMLMSPGYAADEIGVTTAAVNYWIQEGSIEAIPILQRNGRKAFALTPDVVKAKADEWRDTPHIKGGFRRRRRKASALSDDDIAGIISLAEDGVSKADIARGYGVNWRTIDRVLGR